MNGHNRYRRQQYRRKRNLAPGNITKAIKEQLYRSHHYTCKYCGSSEKLSIDHITPLSKGGTSKKENLQVLCDRCHHNKDSRSEVV